MAGFLNQNKVYAGDLINQTIGLTGQFIQAYDKAEEERVRSSLINMQAQYDNDQNNLMLQLQQTNDVDEMQKLVTNFQSEHVSSTSNKDSKYYCQTEFEARKAKEMFEGQNVALQGKVATLMLQKTNEQQIAKDSDTINLYRQNKTGNDGIQAETSLYSSWYNSGKIDAEKYAALKESAANYYAAKDYENYSNSIVDEAVRSGKGVDYIKSQIDNYKENYSYTGADGTPVQLNTKEIKDQAFKAAQTNYSVKLHEYQDGNTNTLSNIYTSIMATDDPQQQAALCDSGLAQLQKWTGKEITSNVRDEYAQKFNNLKKYIDKYGSVSVSASGSSSENLEKFKDALELNTDNFIEAVRSGELHDLQGASEILLREMHNDFIQKDWKETKNLTPEQKEEKWNKEWSQTVTSKIMNSKVINDFLSNEPQYATVKARYDKIKKDIAKHPENYVDGAESYIAGLVFDFITTSGKDVDPAVMAQEFEKQENLITIAQVNKLYKNTDNIAGNDKDLLRSIDAVTNNDVVYTDASNTEHWVNGTKEQVEKIAEDQRIVAARTFGIKPENMQITYMKTKNDMQPIPVFNWGKLQLHFENENGSAILIDQNGDRYNIKGAKDMRKDDKAEDKVNSQKAKAARQQENETVKKQQDEAIKVTYDKLPSKLKEQLTKEQWEQKRTTTEGYDLLLKYGYFDK